MLNKLFILIGFLILFSLPGALWYDKTGDLAIYYSNAAPKGQLYYVLSKLAGMYALAFIAWQIIATLLSRLHILQLHWQGTMHSIFGTLIVILALAHTLLFFSAMTSRQGFPAWNFFVPDFKDYYHTNITFGLIGLIALFAVPITGMVRFRKHITIASQLHNIYWVAISFVYIHALSIGTESQTDIGLVFYVMLGILAFSLWILFVIKQLKTEATCS